MKKEDTYSFGSVRAGTKTPLDPHWLDSEGREPDISPMPTRRMTQLDEADKLSRSAMARPEPVLFTMKDILTWLYVQEGGDSENRAEIKYTNLQLRKAMNRGGMKSPKTKISIGGRTQYVMLNYAATQIVNGLLMKTSKGRSSLACEIETRPDAIRANYVVNSSW